MDGSGEPRRKGPLDGVRVVDLTQFVLGPCTWATWAPT
jgi:crotonobetainyl-CoA:carnitine CoA-transferase CaiB-like acyl-CoA transferase